MSAMAPSAVAPFHKPAEAAQIYLGMLYACDPAMVDGIFEKDARPCTVEGGALVYRSGEITSRCGGGAQRHTP